jgi:small neutral amino acid transporter SnatA (MarC family)
MLIIPVQLIVFFILLFIPYHLSERIEKWIDGSYILVALSLLSLFLFEYLIKQFGRQPDATDINSGL